MDSANYTLDAKIAAQRAAVLAHRQALGLGEYTALKGTEVLYDRTVTYRNDAGKPITINGATLHIGATMAILWIPCFPKPLAISRRLGTFEVQQCF